MSGIVSENTLRSSEFDRVISAFASIPSSGLILTIGVRSLTCCQAILDSMDTLTRLVVNLPQDSAKSEIETKLESDLRVAIHRQHPEEFLDDVQQHLLNLVILCGEDYSPSIVDRIAAMMQAGACMLVLKSSETQSIGNGAELAEFNQADIGDCILCVKKQYRPENVRRGGRRAKLADR